MTVSCEEAGADSTARLRAPSFRIPPVAGGYPTVLPLPDRRIARMKCEPFPLDADG